MRAVFKEILEAIGRKNLLKFLVLFFLIFILVFSITWIAYQPPMTSKFHKTSTESPEQTLHERH